MGNTKIKSADDYLSECDAFYERCKTLLELLTASTNRYHGLGFVEMILGHIDDQDYSMATDKLVRFTTLPRDKATRLVERFAKDNHSQ